jgi:hypothetical protein
MQMVKNFLLPAIIVSLAACATQKQSNPAPTPPDDDKRLECSAYYELLSVAGDQPDISEKQSGKAFYALLHQVGDTPDSKAVVSMKMDLLRDEIPGRMTAENVAAFRTKHDAECKALLKSAWCDTYKGFSPSACVK